MKDPYQTERVQAEANVAFQQQQQEQKLNSYRRSRWWCTSDDKYKPTNE